MYRTLNLDFLVLDPTSQQDRKLLTLTFRINKIKYRLLFRDDFQKLLQATLVKLVLNSCTQMHNERALIIRHNECMEQN